MEKIEEIKTSLPKSIPEPFSGLLNDLDKGRLKIPQFQRNFVWPMKKSAKLLDSIVKGYPIGTFIMWNTNANFPAMRNIGNLNFKDSEPGNYVRFVIDGQQRITSLVAALKGLSITRDDKKKDKVDDFSKIVIDLDASLDEHIVLLRDDVDENDTHKNHKIINLQTMLTPGRKKYDGLTDEYCERLEYYEKRITSYNYSITEIKDVTLDVITEIFERVNTGAEKLSVFEIMVAKTYEDGKFDLASRFKDLVNDLEKVCYETISNSIILQIIALILKGECKRKKILELEKEEVIEIWDSIIKAINKTIDYFISQFSIPSSTLLPYDQLIIPFAYFFYKHKDKPTNIQQEYLKNLFWRIALSKRYSSGTDGKLVQDMKRINLIMESKQPEYDWIVDTSVDFIKTNGRFSISASYIKAILCIYASQQPKSFEDNSNIILTNAYLEKANSKNYHHFFPKAYLKKQVEGKDRIDHILNITIIDDHLNKKIIKDDPPSEYMNKFHSKNPQLSETMKTHLIGDLNEFGILDDNYQKFIDQRAKKISEEIKGKITLQNSDEQSQKV